MSKFYLFALFLDILTISQGVYNTVEIYRLWIYAGELILSFSIEERWDDFMGGSGYYICALETQAG